MTGLYLALTVWGALVFVGVLKTPDANEVDGVMSDIAALAFLIGTFGLLGKATGWW